MCADFPGDTQQSFILQGYTKRMFDDTSFRIPAPPDLDDPDPIRRADAIQLIRDPTQEMVEKALTDPDPTVRAAALWRLNVHLSETQIERALRDRAAGVRIRAVLRPEWLSLPQIHRALADENPLVRQAATLRRSRGY